jgi:RNase adapter protein RapZ
VDDQGVQHPEVVLVTGMSGAGRSTAADALEDLGWFVVDNMPPALLPSLVDLAERGGGRVPRIAAVTDVRGGDFFELLQGSLESVAGSAESVRVLFLEADDDALVRRFESSRRPHPLQGEGRVVDGIARERALLHNLRDSADVLIDTTELNVHQLRERVERAFAHSEAAKVRVTVMSFGFKYGTPADADVILDCRFLPNPHWVPDLRMRTGLDAAVSEYVLGQPAAPAYLAAVQEALRVTMQGYAEEGKRYALVAMGCTGGKHRSVAMTEELARRLQADPDVPAEVTAVHRDVGRE